MYLGRLKSFFTALFMIGRAVDRPIARNGHMLRDMGVGTSRHEDDQLPCRRSRSELDPRTTTARGLLGWETRRAV